MSSLAVRTTGSDALDQFIEDIRQTEGGEIADLTVKQLVSAPSPFLALFQAKRMAYGRELAAFAAQLGERFDSTRL